MASNQPTVIVNIDALTGLKRTLLILSTGSFVVKAMGGLVPVCAWCARIPDAAQNWHDVCESHDLKTQFPTTHVICPTCSEQIQARHFEGRTPPKEC